MSTPEHVPRHHDEPLLLPYQRRWVADESAVRVWEKSRRIGASWATAAGAALEAASEKESGGMDVWYISYNKGMTETFIKDCAFWAGIYSLVASDMEEFVFEDEDPGGKVVAFRITFASGHRITGLSSAPRSLRSIQGHIVIDEGAFVDQLAELLKAALAMLMWGGRVDVISTHNGAENPFAELIQETQSGARPYSLHRTTFDDALYEGLYRRICLVKQGKAPTEAVRAELAWSPESEARWRQEMVDFYGDNAEEELFCVPRRSGGAYLSRALIEARMHPDIPVLRWSLPDDFVDWSEIRRRRTAEAWCREHLEPVLRSLPSQTCFVGEDFGRSGDLTVLWVLQRQADLDLRTCLTAELRNAPFTTQQYVLEYLIDRLDRFGGAALDARGNGAFLAEVARQHYGAGLIDEVALSEAWYREHMPRLKQQLEDGTLTLPKDSDVLDDLRAFRVVKGVARLPEKSTRGGAEQRHGDSGVALAMAVYAATVMEPQEWDVVTGPPRETTTITRGY
ncbi:terminase large subunit domain-containing protein [Desulfohalovibrio reitneri]|uniref:terminase large subunit domain-containing protein n=1 Tax=Desulfohalovibrio reitneri TaxID=1307759 RepID=UPI00069018E8|nr:terminase family protein [Desulfohalovibrio reitneri]